MQIIKKDGRLEDFNIDKVEDAAYKALVGVSNKHADDIAEKIAESVEDTLEALGLPRISFDVVHNLVEFALMDYDKSAAKHYICYRKERQNVRDGYDSLMASLPSKANNFQVVKVEDSGHDMIEEQTQFVLDQMTAFFTH